MKLILKVLTLPVNLFLSLFIRLCAGVLSHTAVLFGLASSVLTLLAVPVLLTGPTQNAIALLVAAFLVSPLGIPMLAVKLLGGLQSINLSLKGLIHS